MRSIAKLMKDWQFTGPNGVTTAVELPHTWNARDGQDGGNDYWRGCCTYCTRFAAPVYDPAQQQVWLQFEGVNASAAVLLNGQQLCTHDGGYSTFRAEVTELLQAENQLTVRVDNSVNDRVYPQKADFTFYGGIYRDVSLLVVNKNHIALGHFGDTGVKITPALQENSADIQVETLVEGSGTVTVELLDAEGRTVAKGDGENASLHLDAPHLWNGIKDPYLYTCIVRLVKDGQPVDEVTTRVGLRSFSVDAKKGFFLNGRPYPLHGVSRHQDRKGLGNAITREMHDEDMALIRELGANTVRLAHYQHDQYFYDLCDQYGMVVWAEIPYISEHLPNGRENTISQMKELIHQNYNHPSIVCWGVSNEITISTKDKADMLDNHRVLNELCHKMDPTRLTTLACYAMCGPFNPVAHITDLVSWNLYLGWYVPGLFLNDLWMDFFHLVYPNRPLGFSEYGAEGMPNLHSAHPRRGDHTEEYQPKYFGIGGEKTEKIKVREYIQIIKNNDPMQRLMVAGAGCKLALSIATNTTVLCMLYGCMMGNYDGLYLPMMVLGYVCSVPFFLLTVRTSQKEGQKASLMKYVSVALVCYVGVLVLLLLWGRGDAFTLSILGENGLSINLYTILFIAFFGIGYGAYYATADMPIPMVADCSDYETYRSGKYIPGIMGTLFSLVDKLVSSLSATVVGIAVSFVGLQSLPTQYDPYTPGMNWVVIVLFCIIPMVAWAATLIAMKGYTLTGAKMKEIQAVNACRRDAVAKGMKLEEAMDKWQTMDQLPAEYRS